MLLQARKVIRGSFLQQEQNTDLTLYQAWRKEGSTILEGELNLLDQAATKTEADQCCDRIEKLLERLLKEREEIKK